MRIIVGFVLGILTGLAFNRIPYVEWFKDQPQTPTGWEPKKRQWQKGDEVPWELEIESGIGPRS